MRPQEGSGPQTDKHMPRSPFSCKFVQMSKQLIIVHALWHLALAWIDSRNLSMVFLQIYIGSQRIYIRKVYNEQELLNNAKYRYTLKLRAYTLYSIWQQRFIYQTGTIRPPPIILLLRVILACSGTGTFPTFSSPAKMGRNNYLSTSTLPLSLVIDRISEDGSLMPLIYIQTR